MLSEALSFEFDPIGVVDEAIEDCIGDGSFVQTLTLTDIATGWTACRFSSASRRC